MYKRQVHTEDAPHSERLFQRKYWLPIYLAFTVAAFNQLAGINAILYYLNYIFAMAGFNKVSGDLQAVAVGAMNLLATLVGMSLIDKLGRKTLLLELPQEQEITAKDVGLAAEKGDALSRRIVTICGRKLGLALALSLIHIFWPLSCTPHVKSK